MVSPEGEQLADFIGLTGREIALKIAKLNLLSRPDHYCDVAIELTKAEMAAKTKQNYVQDRPLIIGSAVIK